MIDRIVRMLGIVAALASSPLLAAENGKQPMATFNVGGVALTMPLPDGYCEPSGAMIAVAQAVATIDSTNVTDLTLYRCDATPRKMGDYTLIKTPVRAIALTIDRATLLAQVGPEFDKPLVIDRDKIAGEAARGLDRLTGQKTKVSMQIDPRGHDDVCAYLGGRGLVSAGTVSDDVAVGGCITAAGGRAIMVFRYTDYHDQRDIDRMMKEARALALTIRPVAGP